MKHTTPKLRMTWQKLLIIISCWTMIIFAGAQQQNLPKPKQNPGRDRVFTIMYEGAFGINDYNKKITYAETQNLYEDVNVMGMALYFPSRTDLGQTFLLDTLSNVVSPKDNNSTITRRQKVIASLVKNTDMQEEITILLQDAREHEIAVMELMTNRDRILEKIKIREDAWEIMKPWYTIKKYMAEFPLWNAWGQVTDALLIPVYAGISAAQASLAFDTLNYPDYQFFNPELAEKANKAINPYQAADSYFERVKNIQEFGNTKVLSPEFNSTVGYAAGAVGTGFAAIDKAYDIYNDYQKTLKNRQLIHALNRLVMISEQLDILCKKNGIETQFSISSIKDPKGLAMIQGLKHPRYQNKEESIVISTPWINTFITTIYEQDIHLAPIFASIAEMDAYNAIASKMIELQPARNKICIAQTLQQAKPRFNAKGFWNLIVPNPVPNSLDEDRNVILTGPNTGGKSTVIRSILQNIILSQTFGIATGESFASTLYDVIYSSLKISDDISKGLSRFASELKRGSDIIIRAKTLRPDEKFFFVLDELFTGTNAKDGEIAAYEFVNDDLASNFTNAQFIFATHFDKLKEIEQKNPAMFANYKIDAPTPNAQGKLIYPYTLSKGVSNISTALQMKKEAGLAGKTELLDQGTTQTVIPPTQIKQNPAKQIPPAKKVTNPVAGAKKTRIPVK
ncbi:MAG: hypothetical protein JO129_00240 [Candidatus Dependentiae bacterium]|nr:hypothetical protein [Candidatus Dependentiae bacterium]